MCFGSVKFNRSIDRFTTIRNFFSKRNIFVCLSLTNIQIYCVLSLGVLEMRPWNLPTGTNDGWGQTWDSLLPIVYCLLSIVYYHPLFRVHTLQTLGEGYIGNNPQSYCLTISSQAIQIQSLPTPWSIKTLKGHSECRKELGKDIVSIEES